MPFKTGSWGEQAVARSARRKEYFRIFQKRRYIKKRDEIKSYAKSWHKNHPKVASAEQMARYYIDIPEGQLCEKCNISFATQRHHPDYSKPLKIMFLCASCHRTERGCDYG